VLPRKRTEYLLAHEFENISIRVWLPFVNLDLQKFVGSNGWNRLNQERGIPPDNTSFPRVEWWISQKIG